MLCCVVLCWSVLCFVLLCYVVVCCAGLCFAVLSGVVLCWVLLCSALLCSAVLCCVFGWVSFTQVRLNVTFIESVLNMLGSKWVFPHVSSVNNYQGLELWPNNGNSEPRNHVLRNEKSQNVKIFHTSRRYYSEQPPKGAISHTIRDMSGKYFDASKSHFHWNQFWTCLDRSECFHVFSVLIIIKV